MKGLLFDIKRYAVNDGPGIRTTAFLKGCPLICRWCHNPESQNAKPETMPIKRKLGDQVFDDVQTVGYEIDSDELVERLARDFIFFDESGGGVTFSGGEPLLQAEFLVDCLGKCVARSIQTCVDTAAAVRTPLMDEIIRLTDIFLLDVKTADKAKFSEYVGHGFDVFLENLKLITERARRVIIRIPVIPSFNDDEQSVKDIIALLRKYPKITEVSLLPFHRIGNDKYRRLGRKWLMGDIKSLSPEKLAPIEQLFEKEGFKIFST